MAMCGAEGTGGPSCRISMPSSNRGADSSRPETSCEDPDASSTTVPPRTAPRPWTVNGTAARPPSSMCAPSCRSAARIGPTGRCLARASPSKATTAEVSAASPGRNRMTVPALPTSTLTAEPGAGCPGVTRQAVRESVLLSITASARSAAAASMVSLARSGFEITAGPSLSAARTRARLVMDLEAGSRTRALTGPSAAGEGQVRPWLLSGCIRLSVSSGRPQGATCVWPPPILVMNCQSRLNGTCPDPSGLGRLHARSFRVGAQAP